MMLPPISTGSQVLALLQQNSSDKARLLQAQGEAIERSLKSIPDMLSNIQKAKDEYAQREHDTKLREAQLQAIAHEQRQYADKENITAQQSKQASTQTQNQQRQYDDESAYKRAGTNNIYENTKGQGIANDLMRTEVLGLLVGSGADEKVLRNFKNFYPTDSKGNPLYGDYYKYLQKNQANTTSSNPNQPPLGSTAGTTPSYPKTPTTESTSNNDLFGDNQFKNNQYVRVLENSKGT